MKSPLGIDICLELSKTLYRSLWNCKSQKSPTAFPQNCPSDPRRANVPSSPKPLSIKGTFSNPAISGGLFWPLSGEVVEQLWIYVFLFLLMKRNEYGKTDRSFYVNLLICLERLFLRCGIQIFSVYSFFWCFVGWTNSNNLNIFWDAFSSK